LRLVEGSRTTTVKTPVTKTIEATVQPQAGMVVKTGGDHKVFGLPSWEDIQIAPVGGVVSGLSRVALGVVAGGVGFLGGLLFGGGQEQQQQIQQTPNVTVTPAQPTDVVVSPLTKFLMDIIQRQQIQAGGGAIDISGGTMGDVGTSEITNITNTYPTTINIQKTLTETYPTQITVTKTVTTAAQEATQERGLDLMGIAVVAVAGILGFSMLKGDNT